MEEEKKIESKAKKEVKENFQLAEVATQTAIMVKNEVTGDILDETKILALILNKLDRIERAVA